MKKIISRLIILASNLQETKLSPKSLEHFSKIHKSLVGGKENRERINRYKNWDNVDLNDYMRKNLANRIKQNNLTTYDKKLKNFRPSKVSEVYPKSFIEKNIKPKINRMKQFTKNPIPEDMVTYRGAGSHINGDTKKGTKVHERGFMSTSLDPKVAKKFSSKGFENHLLALHLPKGKKAHYMDIGDNPNKSEKEVLIHPGSTWQVTHHTQHGKIRVAHLKALLKR